MSADGPGAAFLLVSPVSSRLVLSGEVDVSLTQELTEATGEAQRRGLPVEIDVRNVTFMDSSAMAMLARLAYQVPERLTFIQPPDVVRFLLDVTALHELVDVVEEDPGFAEHLPTQGAEASA
ncbi:STAS domain-containing protein [Georgenia sp. 10Sc9-8]|uniref:STAS domain-containing protein n=1 Tax=Georgenia halotolerans TaxID=3028317 RepID=A0ABT5U169_9MICO|nr:STAS domain-containing protein [Georgenia halotolerans]